MKPLTGIRLAFHQFVMLRNFRNITSGRVIGKKEEESHMTLHGFKTMAAGHSQSNASGWESLNANCLCDEARRFEEGLFRRIISQDDAVLALSQIYQIYLAKMNMQGRPLGALLFLGPTGSGKTRSVEAAAEVLFRDTNSIIKIDCAEYQHSHEIAKLIGSPPGYLGHRETPALLTQENLDRSYATGKALTLLLFDEIEKASDTLWLLLLGILDKATLTLGDNRRVDFSKCIVILTSNLGAREMDDLANKKLGFGVSGLPMADMDSRLEKIGVEAARRRFSPEFMNRLDKIVVFHSLTEEAMRRILDLELEKVQHRILALGENSFILNWSDGLKDFLLEEGFDRRYGARPLKRAIERHLVVPLANLIATRQVSAGDVVSVDMDEARREPTFRKLSSSAVVGRYDRGVFARCPA